MQNLRSETRGAALIVAILVLAILLIIVLQFFSASRTEMHRAENFRNSTQADLIADGATALAMAHLNRDRDIHPTVTSDDFSWRTFFNGSFAVGKPALWKPLSINGNPPVRVPLLRNATVGGGVPEIDLSAFDFNDPAVTPPGDALYIPRLDDTLDLSNPNQATPAFLLNKYGALPADFPFVTTNDVGDSPLRNVPGYNGVVLAQTNRMSAEQIDEWADVDSDGDGLRDAIWIPMAIDVFRENDGIDNDLDGRIDEAGERAIFLYWGGNDGIDNDGDGEVDEADEQQVFLTAPLPVWNGNGPQFSGNPHVDLTRLGEFAAPPGAGSVTITGAQVTPVVDRIDNDHNLFVNDWRPFSYLGPNLANWLPADDDPNNPTTAWRDAWLNVTLSPQDNGLRDTNGLLTPAGQAEFNRRRADFQNAYNEINTEVYYPAAFNNDIRVTSTGEPVCEIIGRAAVLITDESSKVNVNIAGARTYRDGLLVAPAPTTLPSYAGPLTRAISQGLGPQEYETRVLPGLGVALTDHIFGYTMGAPLGRGMSMVSPASTEFVTANDATYGSTAFSYDVSLPGYARADSNGNALALALDGLDNDGDGLVDEGGQWLDLNGNGVVDPGELWGFEGIDEPTEAQQYRPLRNLLAETDGTNNDPMANEAIDEVGELGDRLFRSEEQLKLITQIGTGRYNALRNAVSVHSNDRNDRYRFYDDNGLPLPTAEGSGFKLDYNLATGEQIAAMLRYDFGYLPFNLLANIPTPTPEQTAAALFAAGLRREGQSIVGTPILDGLFNAMPADPALRANQLAANVRDNRDRNLGRTDVTTVYDDLWWADVSGHARTISYTQSGVENIRINEVMVRPVRRVEAEMNPAEPLLNPNYFSSITDSAGNIVPDFSMQSTSIAPTTWNVLGTHIGDRAFYATTTPLVDHDNSPLTPPIPNSIEFCFSPSPGLPPSEPNGGRYYLMVNTLAVDANGQLRPTVLNSTDIQYAIKYRLKGTPVDPNDPAYTTITQDLARNPNLNIWRTDAVVGLRDMMNSPGIAGNPPTGWVFLPGDRVPGESTRFPLGYQTQDEAFSVRIPPYSLDLELCVAIRFGSTPPPQLAINFFDFSQEPDHEWVEIANVSQTGDPVDLSGWQLTVGAPRMKRQDPDPTVFDPDYADGPTIMTIPDGTFIAPGGKLLLAMSKYDPGVGRFNDPALLTDPFYQSPFNRNGIGLARGGATLGGVTEPPIPPYNPLLGQYMGDSVFRRGTDVDFLDVTGDGVDDAPAQEIALQSTADASGFPGSTTPAANKAWDRIVQLHVPQILAAQNVYQLVLSGGIFPNYPEHDGLDNDGDLFELQNDLIDNDGDGLVDEDSAADRAAGRDVLVDNRPEGIDEGRWDVLPAFTGTAPRQVNAPGIYGAELVPYVFTNSSGVVGIFQQDYMGTSADAPDWKAFTEKRWYPGDEVIVTLYAGPAYLGHVADRVTYSERDVVNRAVDDILTCPYPGLNPEFPSFWPDNTMALDFYRSVERKHPLYTGDLRGVSNRWQATDGAYDDWSPSTSPIERVLNPDRSLAAVVNRIDVASSTYGSFIHAISGSPLRMNLPERVLTANVNATETRLQPDESFDKAWAFGYSVVRNVNFASTGDLATLPSVHFTDVLSMPTTTPANNYLIEDLPVNHSFRLVGGDTHQDIYYDGTGTARPSNDSVLLGQRHVLDATALITGAAQDPLVLSAAQASFYPLSPTPDIYVGGDAALQFSTTALPQGWVPVFLYALPDSGVDEAAATADVELTYLRPTSFTTFQYQMNFLFNQPPVVPANMSLNATGPRWPLEQRTVMYVSGNSDSFVPTDARPPVGSIGNAAEALFEWDGADGLQNGEYDVYIVTKDHMRSLEAAHAASGGAYLTPFGARLVEAAGATLNRDVQLDVEVFTDRDADRRCWVDTGDGYPQPGEMDRGVVPANSLSESAGMQYGRTPDEDGIIHYGTVRVENNYLAVLLRNWATRGTFSTFSRVVLAPHHRSTGRLNLNTVATRPVDANGDGILDAADVSFNPLIGVPGVLARFGTGVGTNVTGDYFAVDSIYPADNANIAEPTYPLPAGTWDYPIGDAPVNVTALDITRRITGGRPAWPDGRYYRTPADLLAQPNPNNADDVTGVYPRLLSNRWEFPARFEDIAFRLSRMTNLVTTRSNVFEITVTAQTGTVSNTDLNNDGRIDYRNDFIVTGEKKTRTVYER